MTSAYLTPTSCNSRVFAVGAKLNENAGYFEGQPAPAHPKVFSTYKLVGAGSELCIWIRNPHGTFFDISSFTASEIEEISDSDDVAAALIVDFASHRLSELEGTANEEC